MRTNELSKEDLESVSGGDKYVLTISNGTGKLEFCSTQTIEGMTYTICKTL